MGVQEASWDAQSHGECVLERSALSDTVQLQRMNLAVSERVLCPIDSNAPIRNKESTGRSQGAGNSGNTDMGRV